MAYYANKTIFAFLYTLEKNIYDYLLSNSLFTADLYLSF